MIGVYVQGSSAAETIEIARQLEDSGVPALWLTTGGLSPDAPTVFAAAAMVTRKIKLGTSVTQTWPRHPVALASQCLALAQVAPGRFRIGLGPSHKPAVESVYGVEYRKPLLNLREYLIVLTGLLRSGEVDFAGAFVKTRTRLPGAPIDVPVMASALRPASFRLCGELADGAISWVCPWPYLRDVALPAMREGAEAAGRPTPPLVAHVPVCLSEDREVVYEAARPLTARYGNLANYLGMFRLAGYDDPAGADLDRVIDDLVVFGDEEAVSSRLTQILGEGAGEVIAHPYIVGEDRGFYLRRFFDVVAKANRQAGVAA